MEYTRSLATGNFDGGNMRGRFLPLTVTLAAILAIACAQKSPQAPPRQFTNSVGMKFVRIDPGSFKMGWEEQGPIHDVKLSKGYYLQTTELTQAQWQAVMGDNPSTNKGPELPVETVSWDEAQGFLRKLNVREKETRYRLPTEAEWEYACRAGGREPDAASNLDDVAWWYKSTSPMTYPVGQKKPNVWELYDMRGNVWEWVQDWYGPYSAERQVDPQGPPLGDAHVLKGGSFRHDAANYRCTQRGVPDRIGRYYYCLGFRCARTL
jgi:formylglycine-generating enzyme required for sulfatase activity